MGFISRWVPRSACCYAGSFITPAGEPPTLVKSAKKKGDAGIRDYWVDTNQRSLEDKDTGILPG
jgi:hypothetical protein